ncbi:hypothetical protein AAA799B03_00360 [Marine Group I thaumarchaeote SCGC AAA799-B03]|uniref:Uncharacterized protein n=3 Tax=Marine Group I TaxID=905826 RepID=A0A087S8G8_9ARCH|nr:hypothetical protein AAA799N04_00382 [Marine Group I thaumarchaeote SCGC AAA799-N04]KFM18048.1 hypothetical protein SCCGRSA3_01402 [Marine Group I thaumarchaeote SCGC RSA3]KFM22022.1 hypothetical protein AAA799B03_00360 [Marine Group I thaumarchaeote SCGC AAA799-B03]
MSDINKDEEAQLQWELEVKRIQKIKNPTESTEPEPEPVVEPAHEPEELPEISINTSYDEKPSTELNSAALLDTVSDAEVNSRITFEEFTDEKTLISHDAFGNKQMKIKVLEVSDETPPMKWKFGDRVKVTKILITIKHLTTQEVEEAEFDVEAIERELQEKRHYTSTNRWIPAEDIKNGYVVGSKHTRLISDAAALDYIVF